MKFARSDKTLKALAALALAFLTAGDALAGGMALAIDGSHPSGERIQVAEGAGFEVKNVLAHQVANVRVLAVGSGKNLAHVRVLGPGQSLSFAFSRAGAYALCYAADKTGQGRDTCLEIDVIKRMPA